MLQGEEEDLLGGSRAAEKRQIMEEMEALRTHALKDQEAHEAQLQWLKADLEPARQDSRQAQREIAELRAKLTVQDEVHKQELDEMRRQMAVTAAAASEDELQNARGRIREMHSRLRLAQTEHEERLSLREAERVFHQQEVKHLQAQIARAKQETLTTSSNQDGGLVKKSQLLLEKSEPEEACTNSDAQLIKACDDLQKPASELLQLFGLNCPSREQASHSTSSDLEAQAQVINALTWQMSELNQLLQSRVAQHT